MSARRHARNPGPDWGSRFVAEVDRRLSPGAMRHTLRFGSWFGLPFLPSQRHASREYLSAISGRPAGAREVHQHFSALMENLWIKLQVGRGYPHHFRFAASPHAAPFRALAESDQPVLFGSLHVGESDLLGCFLHEFGRRIHMVRLRMPNAYEQEQLGQRFRDSMEFIWVNEPRELLFALKQALDADASLALQCDRVEFGTRHAGFEFLGARRLFPVTIYHLAYLYRRPVVFAFGLPEGHHRAVVHPSRILPPPSGSKADYFRAAHAHFQEVLGQLESLLREQPYQWFNFIPLNPPVEQAS